MASETLNMKTVPLTRVTKQIKMQLLAEDYTPVIVIGKSGIGKTEKLLRKLIVIKEKSKFRKEEKI